ncbi:MAG: aldose epimerase family protein [Chitinophagaceae bacterium]
MILYCNFSLAFLMGFCQKNVSNIHTNSYPVLPDKKAFLENINGEKTQLIYLKNKNNIQAAITNYGARLVSLLVPDKKGKLVSVVVGFDSITNYVNAHSPYYGATIGRYANRIAEGKLKMDDKIYPLTINNNGHTNHGGKNGFNNKIWKVVRVTNNTVELSYLSKDLEEGFPGNLSVKVIYQLTDENELKIKYQASTDKKTVINLTNHSFFNLSGEGTSTIIDHILKLNAGSFTPINEKQLPTGEIKLVNNSPFDFRNEKEIGKSINAEDVQLKYGSGYDHNFILNKTSHKKLQFAASIFSPASGIVLNVFTDQPGIQFFTANAFKGLDTGRTGKPIVFRSAFCLETQHFPDAQNHSNFPSTILLPGQIFTTQTDYKFSVKTDNKTK